MNHVWFAHGKESGPQGRKIEALSRIAEELGWAVTSPDYTGTHNADERVAMLLELYQATLGKTVLVGSSMGGYVSMVASQQLAPEGLFLMAPAIGITGYEQPEPEIRADKTLIVHGWQDEVIPPGNVIAYAEKHRLPLQLLDDEHTLSHSIPQLTRLFHDFLRDVTDRPTPARLAPHI